MSSPYINGVNVPNIVLGNGLSLGARDQFGNATLSALGTLPATLTSAQLAAVVTDETGSGSLVFGTGSTLVTPTVEVPNSLLKNNFYNNFATAAQAPAATVRTYITGSAIGPFVAGTIAVGTVFKWAFDLTKTGAGSATSTFDICFGTAGTTADAAVVSFTKPAGTAAADQGWVEITAVVKTASATGVVLGNFRLGHNLAATGHAQIPFVSVVTTSGATNLLTPTFAGVCITSGTGDVITINQVDAQAINL
jgi:hypothetical protein